MTTIDDIGSQEVLDPYASDRGTGGGGDGPSSGNFVHIRSQQRKGRKSLTTIQGLGGRFDCRKLCKHFKKLYNCNGTVVENEEMGDVIQLQGDWRIAIAKFLEEEGIAAKDEIKLHGA